MLPGLLNADGRCLLACFLLLSCWEVSSSIQVHRRLDGKLDQPG